ncbi:MAG: glycerophosphoryl diester phosphodiesterase [Ramlibacter sp.]|jgi:glycerophosphoryl diester phosphodiesterase|nr:glycerophosphoryl diester phosphodiesterase [Ramlibacter sp.]
MGRRAAWGEAPRAVAQATRGRLARPGHNAPMRSRSIPTLVAALLLLAAQAGLAFDLQGHRGARGLSPENTLPAFARALDLGVSTLELDVAVTADGQVVVAHDPYLNPAFTRDGNGQWLEGARGPLIRSLTLAQLRAYDVGRIRPDAPYARTFAGQQAVDGTRIPTLAEVFELVRERKAGHVRFNIETKLFPNRPDDTVGVEAMVEAVLRVVRDSAMRERVSIQSFDWRSLQRVQQLEPNIRTVYLTIQTANNDNVRDPAWTAGIQLAEHGSVPRLVKAAGGGTWSPNAGALTQALVDEAHALRLAVIPWTVNDPADMDRLVGWNVDGLITDYPDRLREVLQRRGVALPPPAPAAAR